MLAYRRDDVRELNQAAHALMLGGGRLGPEEVTLGEREFRVGDRVLCRRNEPRFGVRNGTRATIVELEPGMLTVRTDAGMTRSLPLPYVTGHLDHAYALTGHAAQGATFNRAFVLLHNEGALGEWGYVACSRARTETRLYLADVAREREAPGREPGRRSLSERAADALSRSSAEPLALEQARASRDATARLHARQQEQFEWQRARAAERLAAAQRELERLGWRGRLRHAAKLRAEIALQRAALRLAEESRATLKTPTALEPRTLAREARERVRSRFLQRDRTTERACERRGLGIELDR
jgi:hypothetical protein